MSNSSTGLRSLCAATALTSALWIGGHAQAGVTASEANALGTTLTPLGGEMAGNADGSIPAWTGGMTSDPLYKHGGRRDHLFKDDKPLFSITPANMNDYADKLTEGTKALLKLYPQTYRVDVHKTVRAAAAPQWVYDNTKKNAVSGNIIEGPSGPMPDHVFGGIPFPIPKNGTELIWNHLLAWHGVSWNFNFNSYLITARGDHVSILDGRGMQQPPYYNPEGSWDWLMDPKGNNGMYVEYILKNAGPPVRAGEGVLQHVYLDSSKDTAWVYLTGQRRVRMLPNACCDTPHPATAGLLGYDEIYGFFGRMDRFEWNLVGKKEMYIPYNANQAVFGQRKDGLFLGNHMNPDHLRWELHRVWVVDATLKPGNRHTAPKGRYYFDEDTGYIILIDRWDAKGQLWKANYDLPFAAPDVPGELAQTFGYNDLLSGTGFMTGLYGDYDDGYVFYPRRAQEEFTPDALAGEGIR